MGAIVALIIGLLAILVIGYFLMNMNRSDAVKDNAIAGAAESVGNAADNIGNQTTPTRYRYVMEAGAASDVTAWLATANRHGQASRLFKGSVVYTGATGVPEYQYLFVERVDKAATFTWAAAALPATVDLVPLLELMNSQGALGYAWRGVMQIGATTQALFVRDSSRTGPFSYRRPAAPLTLAALSTQ